MRWISRFGMALALGLAGPALAQDSKDEGDIDIDALLGDEEPKGEEPAAEAETAAEPAMSDKEKADKESLDQVSYEARAKFDVQYFGHTLVRAERHLGHLDVYFITQDGKKMMAEVRPDHTLGKVEKASW